MWVWAFGPRVVVRFWGCIRYVRKVYCLVRSLYCILRVFCAVSVCSSSARSHKCSKTGCAEFSYQTIVEVNNSSRTFKQAPKFKGVV